MRTCAIRAVACGADLRFRSAELIPRDAAADGVDEAHGGAADCIATCGRVLRFAARTSAFIAAIEIALIARGLCARDVHARLIPLDGAAVVIYRAHGIAATCVVATWSCVHFAATAATDIAAIRRARSADYESFIRTELIPICEAAVEERRIVAHECAARSVRATSKSVRREA